MRTEDLINALKADAKPQTMPLGRAWRTAVPAAAVLAAIAFFLLLGPRPDIADALETLRFPFKFVVTLVLAGAALSLLPALSRPGAPTGRRWLWLLAAPLLLAAAVAAELLNVPPEAWGRVWWGTNMALCLTFIPLIGLAPLGVFLAVLRHGAPTRPRLAGAIAGLLAGAIAATFYAAHCPDDSPLFVASWYSLAIAGLTLAGTLLGPRIARW